MCTFLRCPAQVRSLCASFRYYQFATHPFDDTYNMWSKNTGYSTHQLTCRTRCYFLTYPGSIMDLILLRETIPYLLIGGASWLCWSWKTCGLLSHWLCRLCSGSEIKLLWTGCGSLCIAGPDPVVEAKNGCGVEYCCWLSWGDRDGFWCGWYES